MLLIEVLNNALCVFKVEHCKMPSLAVRLSLQCHHSSDETCIDTSLVSFITGLLLGSNTEVVTWFAQYMKNCQKVILPTSTTATNTYSVPTENPRLEACHCRSWYRRVKIELYTVLSASVIRPKLPPAVWRLYARSYWNSFRGCYRAVARPIKCQNTVFPALAHL